MTNYQQAVKQNLLLFTPPEKCTVVEWCEKHLILQSGASSKPGRFKAWPWQIDPMNCVQDQGVASEVLMWPAQLLGKTMTIIGVIGWSISESPCPMLCIFPSVESGAMFSKTKLSPLLMDTPVLGKLVHEDALRYRKQGAGDATISLKRFPGGWLLLAGCSSPTGLKSQTTKRQYFDEVSSYPVSAAGDEGDPIAIATKRSETYPDSFQIFTSTPAIAGTCRISMEVSDSSYKKWHVKCPACAHEWVIMWKDIQWPKRKDSKGKTIHNIEAAYVQCESCGVHIDDGTRQKMAMAGRWIATNPLIKNREGFWANAFICCLPCKRGYRNRLHQWAEEFLKAEKRGTYFLRAFQTSVLAEPYNIDSEPPIGFESIYERREKYREQDGEIIIPEGVLLLTVGCDIQRDRLEAEILGTGMDGETWGIEYRVFYGNPEQPMVYKEFDSWAVRRFRHAKQGNWMWVACICIDAGFKGEAAYRYIKKCGGRKVFATNGERGFAPLGSNWTTRSKSNNDRLWNMKIDGAKESLYSRLRIDEPGAGYQHFPSNTKCHYDIRYFQQLTSEVLKTSASGQKFFEKPTGETRNEALDCRIIASAAVQILEPQYDMIAKKLEAVPQNDWREKEAVLEAALTAPVPDLRDAKTESVNDVDMSSLRNRLAEKNKRWMDYR